MSITSLKPYTYAKVVYRKWWVFGTLSYHIFYEHQLVRTVHSMDEEDLKQIVFLLNAAYQLGYSDGTVQGYNNDLPVLHHELQGY